MSSKEPLANLDTSTEEKIKNAARKVFQKKGFAAARTRDIAEEADINLALLNYYFRSKQKLFDLIMEETMLAFVESIRETFNDQNTSFTEKLQNIVDRYIDLLVEQPQIPLFMLSELRNDPSQLASKVNAKVNLRESVFMQQFMEEVANGNIKSIHPLQFVMNMMSLTVAPFMFSPMVKAVGDLDNESFNELMRKRKRMIPIWLKAMFEPD